MEGGDRVAAGALPVWVVLGGRGVVRPVAGGARAAGRVAWPGKVETTFSDAITAVRRWLWVNWVFANHGYARPFQNSHAHSRRPCFQPWRRLRNGGKRAEDELRVCSKRGVSNVERV